MTSIMDNFEGHLGAFVAEEGIYSLEHLMRKAGFGAALSPEPSDTDSAEDGGFDRIASPQSKAGAESSGERSSQVCPFLDATGGGLDVDGRKSETRNTRNARASRILTAGA